ncbi:hypothetical protein BP5796_01938 [Coleophoma crateriformis]|uniref:MYND-type domain-containing protein n=1 Tax=Coleophoma crateriformis TaxID=565419 RepID=A0A3D8T1X5_9HELO|nr:hypothetical protein BP5796_01938 [Coleophoma crateriformis]
MAPSQRFPNFTSPRTFPTFQALPLTNPPSLPGVTYPSAADLSSPYFLLGTLKENMTLSSNPTYILQDCAGQNFACVLRVPDSTASSPKFAVDGLKKGQTLVLANPTRGGVKEGKQGHVAANLEEVLILPTKVERLMELSIRVKSEQVQREGEVEEGEEVCQACGKKGDKLLRCKGCESAWYCDKA